MDQGKEAEPTMKQGRKQRCKKIEQEQKQGSGKESKYGTKGGGTRNQGIEHSWSKTQREKIKHRREQGLRVGSYKGGEDAD